MVIEKPSENSTLPDIDIHSTLFVTAKERVRKFQLTLKKDFN